MGVESGVGRGGYTGDEGKDGFPAPTSYVGVLLAWIQGCILVPCPDGGVDLEWRGGAKRVLVSLKGRRVGAEHGRWGMGGFSALSA